MKQELLHTISEAIELLHLCNLNSKVEWFEERQQSIMKLEEDTEEFRLELLKIKGIISGMGSFLDLPMYPEKNSRLSRAEARKKQSELAERLYGLITGVLGPA